MKPTITFDKISKLYRLGAGSTSLREAIASGISRNVKRDKAVEDTTRTLWALKDVSFEVFPGESFGLIGPNGAGKTTALKVLANITQPTSGRLTINGRISALIELSAGFHPDLTGRENIYLNGAILGMSRERINRVFDSIVDFSGLERFIDTPVKRYSSGMYVRLGFSIAAHVDPDIFVVDEVLAVGDAQFRQKCAVRIEQLRKSGTTIVFVAHNLYMVQSVCEKAIFLSDGQIQEGGDVINVINSYEKWLHTQQIDSMLEKRFVNQDSDNSSSVDITNVTVKKDRGDDDSVFTNEDIAEIQLYFSTRKTFENPNIVLRIIRADGTTCCMIRTIDYGQSIDSISGEGVISVLIDPLQLTGGVYAVDARIMGPIDGIPLAQAHSEWFTVKGLSLNYERMGGVFVPNLARVIVTPTESSKVAEIQRVEE